ncbi:ATPase domain-containing protein [Ramlibacter sp. MMS24-I3-19]|uniref:ATPase domain-containing protein n=1 Tax=Ramlibacter sp. MMS24-I3-19 TaxID=3416606 RepID=UPI003D00AD39
MNEPNDLIPTGIAGLDDILLGGIRRNNNILVEGAPGAGKTTLGLGFIHAGAAHFGEPGVIVSFELEPDKLLRDAAGFSWDLEGLVRSGRVKIIQTSPAVLLGEFHASEGVLAQELKAIGARRLVIDGLTPLKLYAEQHHTPFREDMHTLVEGLSRLGVTTLVTSELGDRSVPGHEHERFVFDTILTLMRQEQRRRGSRKLRVMKSRGQDFIDGEHTMTIEAGSGIHVYRRAQSRPKLAKLQPTSSERITTGIANLDGLMDGGVYRGSVTMVAGISGTGKTVSAVQFLCANADRGRTGLLVSLDEHPEQIMRNAATLGLDLRKHVEAGRILIHFESPLELDLDIHFDRVSRLFESRQVDCIVFDSVAVYEMAAQAEAADYLYALATFFKGRLATVYFNYESPELLGVSQISQELKGSHLVDNIILLSYVEISTKLRRAITVPKVRGSRNVQETREYAIGQGGISIVDEAEERKAGEQVVPQLHFSAYYGLLSRSPSRKSPAIDEAIARGQQMPESSAPAQ